MKDTVRFVVQESTAWLSAFMPSWLAQIFLVLVFILILLLVVYITFAVLSAITSFMDFVFRIPMGKEGATLKFTDYLSFTISHTNAMWVTILGIMVAPFRFLVVGAYSGEREHRFRFIVNT